MLVELTRQAIVITGTDDPVITALVNLMPDYSGGRRLHELYVNKAEGMLPGHYSQLFGTGPAFRSVFYPSWGIDPLWGLAGLTGLDERWWSQFSVALLCQAIAELGSDIRGQMLGAKINDAVAAANAELRARSASTYAQVLAASYPPLVALLQQVDRSRAKEQFRTVLLANVLNRQLWWQAGMWTSPDWEMFNQYAKYLALGATEGEVDALITELVATGLPVPTQVDREHWRSYADALRDKPDVDVADIRAACSGPIAATTYLPTYGGGMPPRLPNGNCYEFTASSQPGTEYRRVGGSCCFSGDTRVLTADRGAVPMRELQRGEVVLTRTGRSAVAYLARPLRGGRELFSLRTDRTRAGVEGSASGPAGPGPVFAATHPFVNAAEGTDAPALLSADPIALAATVPTLGEDGIGLLGEGCRVWSRAGGDQPVEQATVAALERVPPTPADEVLYDLRFAPGSADQEFWVGDGEHFYLVAPEYPRLERAGAAAVAVVAIMEGLLGSTGPGGDGWSPWVIEVLESSGPGIFTGALAEALAVTPSFGAPSPSQPLDSRIDRLYAALGTGDPETAAVAAALFDGLLAAVGQWFASLVALGWRSGMHLGGDLVAVTVFDLALAAPNPVPADAELRLTVAVAGRDAAECAHLFDRRGRDNTRFQHYFDQLIHLDPADGSWTGEVSFAVSTGDVALPVLTSAGVSLTGGVGVSAGEAHQLSSVVLRDDGGAVRGALRFDSRRLGRDAAAAELSLSGLWTEQAADAYANALGSAMVLPILTRIAALGPR